MPQPLLTKPWLKSLSGLCINLSAAWFAVIMVSPVFPPADVVNLTRSAFFGTLFLLFSVNLEGRLELRNG